jgi:hypothetical protein
VSRRPEFLVPAGEITDDLLGDMLRIAGAEPPPAAALAGLTEFERMLAYDWAAREHLRASDNLVRRRPRPSFLEA